MTYIFQYSLFVNNVQMFHEGDMGIVIEKEPGIVSVYVTTPDYQTIMCAIPLCHPKHLKGERYTVEFCEDNCVKISVGFIKILIDFANHKCSNNRNLQNYGSDAWGQDVSAPWNESKF